jgi:hypothetical protein
MRDGSLLKVDTAQKVMRAFVALAFLSTSGCGPSPSGPSLIMQVNGMTVNLTGEFRTAGSTVGIRFTDAQDHPVDVGKVTLSLIMNMPGMPMQASGEVSGSNGNYTTRIKPQMGGRWSGILRYNGPRGSGEIPFEVNVQ